MRSEEPTGNADQAFLTFAALSHPAALSGVGLGSHDATGAQQMRKKSLSGSSPGQSAN